MRAKVCFFDPKKTLFFFLILCLVSCISLIGSCFDARLSRCFFLTTQIQISTGFLAFVLRFQFIAYVVSFSLFDFLRSSVVLGFACFVLSNFFFFLIIFIISLFCVKSHVMIASILVTGADVPSKTRVLKNYSIISISLCKPIMME